MARKTEKNPLLAIALPVIILVGTGVVFAVMLLKKRKVVTPSYVPSEARKGAALPETLAKEPLAPSVIEKIKKVKQIIPPAFTGKTIARKPEEGETKEQYIEKEWQRYAGTRTSPVGEAEARNRAGNVWDFIKKSGISIK